MDRATDERWREALKKKGQQVVRQQLDCRPGPPTELLYDIVDEPPYPTRAYCEAWCRGMPAKSVGMSGTGAMVVIMSILVVVCVFRGALSLSSADVNWLSSSDEPYHSGQSAPQPAAAPHAASASSGAASSSDTSLGNTATQNSSVISTQSQGSIRSGCTAVSNAGNQATVETRAPCSKLGQPFVQRSSGSGG
jgi:hypothetical protein